MLEQIRERSTEPDGEQPLSIRDLLRVPERYLRSVQLERDFQDIALLRQYILTPPLARALERITEGLQPVSGRRAWRITGDYGAGKSSFALILAHLLRDPEHPDLAAIRRVIDFEMPAPQFPGLLPVLITGARESLVPSMARGVARALESQLRRESTSAARAALGDRAMEVARCGDAGALLELISDLAHAPGYAGILLVLDELGKFLEYASLHPDREDIFVLQRLAEMASRSGDRPVILLGLLHQGFHAYAERLPSVARQEWDKVAGRFEEIIFDQPLAHTAALVAGALNVEIARVPHDLVAEATTMMAPALATGWYGAIGRSRGELDPLALYPLHPTVLPVLVRFFARFGQHERSLFSYLLSSEPFGLQSFAERPAKAGAWYRLADFYDYVRATFGHRLAGASFRSQWLRIAGVLDSVDIDDAFALRLLKTVAVLNVLDAEQLLATDAVLVAAVGRGDEDSVVADTIAALRVRGLLHERGAAGGYRLWPNTSVSLESRLAAADRALGPVDGVAAHLEPYLDARPLIARRHYIATGTLRHFEVRYAGARLLREALQGASEADGLVVVALCDTTADQEAAIACATGDAAKARHDVLVAVSPPLLGLAGELQDVRRWSWIAENTPELADDTYAAAEVAREASGTRRVLVNRLAALIGLRGVEERSSVSWWRAGRPAQIPQGRGLLPILSQICDELYPGAPLIRNELLNRRVLSSAAAAARMRLIGRMLTAADRPLLGIDLEKAPPEKSMYLSVLEAGRVHRPVGARYTLSEPPEGDDPLRLRPALIEILATLDAAGGGRVPLPVLVATLSTRPYGVRAGTIPLLLAIITIARAHELAVYENGTFVPRIEPAHILRLTKAPNTFEFQLCRVTGVRVDVFHHLVAAFTAPGDPGRRHEVLDVVRQLSTFAADLPEYTLRSTDLPPRAARVRDALLAAREPVPLLFQQLPEACGVGQFAADESPDDERVRSFVTVLRGAMDDLRAAYPQLLGRLLTRVAGALGEDSGGLDRVGVARRASGVAVAAREPRLRAFATRLADTGLATDAWIEALASFVNARPVSRWTTGDERRACDEIDVLGAAFQRAEAVVFPAGGEGSGESTVRVGLTRSDGMEVMRVVRLSAEHEPEVECLVARLQDLLPDSEELSLASIVRLLDRQLAGRSVLSTGASPDADRGGGHQP